MLPLEFPVVRVTCRSQFTAEDFAFVVKVLARSPRDAVGLVELLSDENERDRILDHDRVAEALVEDTGCLKVSPAFYFYVLARRVLHRAGLEERALSDYVAGVLTFFSRTAQLTDGEEADSARRSFAYISDLLERMAAANPDEAYVLRSHLGNYTLFLSGIFAERVQAAAQRRGAPGLSFYEGIGATCYQTAARHPQARASQLQPVFEQLAAEFRAIRRALNQLAESMMHFHEPPLVIRLPG